MSQTGSLRTVRAAVQTGPCTVEIREFPRPVIGRSDGLLRIESAGICGSDVELYRGNLERPMPMAIGHEPMGIIEEIGDEAAQRWGVQVGDRVAVEILVPCHYCQACLTGRYSSCPHRKAAHGVTSTDVAPGIWGSLSEYMYLAPESIVHPISKDVPAETAALFNPLGAGVRWACHLGQTQIGQTVLILGAGQRGLASLIAAKAAGASRVIMTGLTSDQHKLVLAQEFGADHTIVVDSEDTVDRVRELTGGAMADLVLDLTPMARQPVTDALNSVRHGGRVVLAGLKGPDPVPVPIDTVINRAITIVGAYGVDALAYAEAIRIIESGRFPLEKMHTHTFGLEDTALAIETLGGDAPTEVPPIHVSVNPWQ